MARPAPADWLIAVVVGVAALAVLGKDIARGGLTDADSAAHAMDGVLIHDWVMAGPKSWTTPMLFAERQYGHYPTLGIGKHYPPGFAIFEAVFFAVFGVSGASARLCVVFFGVLAAVGVFAFVRTIADRLAATLAALLMIAIPATTHWGRQAMLEVPTLAVLTWSAVAFSWYLRQRIWRRFAVMAGAALLTILFKQTAVFLICAIAMALTWSSVRGRGPWSHAVCAIVLGLSALGVMLVGLDDLCLKTVSGYDTYADRWGWSSLTFYLRTLPGQTGMIVLPVAALGALLTARRMGDHWWLLAAWLFTSYVMVTAASLKTPRFFYVGLFPPVVWAAFGAARCVRLIPSARLRAAAAVIGCGYIACTGFARPVPDGPDFGAMVTANRERIEGKVVLFSGLRDGDFIFAVRERIPWQKAVIIRGSKLFYTCTAGPDLDLVSNVSSREEIAEVMRRFAFENVFVERDNRTGTTQDGWLRDYLSESGDYARVGSFVVQPAKNWCGSDVIGDVYSLTRSWQRRVDHFDIPIPRTRRSIRVDLRGGAVGERPS